MSADEKPDVTVVLPRSVLRELSRFAASRVTYPQAFSLFPPTIRPDDWIDAAHALQHAAEASR